MTLCFTQIVWDFPLLNMQSDAVKSELSEHLQLKQKALGSILGGWSFSLPATNVAFFLTTFCMVVIYYIQWTHIANN